MRGDNSSTHSFAFHINVSLDFEKIKRCDKFLVFSRYWLNFHSLLAWFYFIYSSQLENGQMRKSDVYSRGVDPGGRGAVAPPPPPLKILGWQTYRFCPPPPPHTIISTTWKFRKYVMHAGIGFKSTVRHYKTIKFNIKNTTKIYTIFNSVRRVWNCDFPFFSPYFCPPPKKKKIDAPDV